MSDALFPMIRSVLDHSSAAVADWFAKLSQEAPPFITHSVDLRYSGYKLAPVDTNLYPAGFNKLTLRSRAKAVEAFDRYLPASARVLLLPEEHTRNLKYLDSLASMVDIIQKTGREVVVGQLDVSIVEPLSLESASGFTITQQPLLLEKGKLQTREGFLPDVVVLNNDFTSPPPAWLLELQQPVMPPAGMGWYRRRKSEHFRAYNALVARFSSDFGLPTHRLGTLFDTCDDVDFMEMTGVELLAEKVERLAEKLRSDYRRDGVTEEPFLFIKSDQGTYGMGIMTARSGDDVIHMNRKIRKKMYAIKGGVANNAVVIQEGVPTVDRIHGHAAEPMLYLVGGEAVGGAYRVHEDKDDRDSLNSVGMRFHPLCCEAGQKDIPPHCDFKVLGLIAKLAAMAVSHEAYSD